MAITIPQKQDIVLTNSVIVGYGEVVAIRTHKGIKYALPGGRFTSSKILATTVAGKLNRIIKANMKKYNRPKFLWINKPEVPCMFLYNTVLHLLSLERLCH